jgi:FkbM family methyltransferase
MDSIRDSKQQYSAGELDKVTFIKAMHAKHDVLFEISAQLAETNISEFRISQDGVTAKFKNPEISMICPPQDLRVAPIEAFNFGDYEPDEIRMAIQIIAKLGGSRCNFLDIGANCGFYSLAFSKQFPGIEGVAFEPIPETFKYLRENLALNGVSLVKPVNMGLSNERKQLLFYTYPSQSGASSMTRNIESSDTLEVSCECSTLDIYFSDYSKPVDFIKCDVEGAELFVFQGGVKFLGKCRPVIFTEMLRKWSAKYKYHPNDIIEFLASLGYNCYVIKDGVLQCIKSVNDYTQETNYVFLHESKHGLILNPIP